MLCIFCLQEKAARTGAGEHPMPLSVGGTWTIDRVCVDCDSKFGYTHDARLTKVTKVVERREALKLSGNAGKVPNGLNQALARGPVAVADQPHHRMLVRQARDGSFDAKTIPNIEFEISKSEDGAVLAAIKPETFVIGGEVSQDEATDLIARKLKATLKSHGIFFADDIIAAAADKMFAEVEVFEKPITVRVGREMINSGYAASLLKAAYEAAWYWLGDGWLSDPEADRIRRHLQGDESITIRGKIQEGEIRAVDVSPTNREHAHVIYLVHTGKTLAVEVHLFDLFSVGVVVSNDPDKYKMPDSGAIVMDAVNATCRELPSKDLFRSERG
jgi:hypothetical protein